MTLPELGRGYRVVTRRDHDAARPSALLFALHAFSTDPSILERHWALDRIAVEQRGWVLVVPEGLRNSHGQPFWNATRACCDGEGQAPDDLAYLRTVLSDVKRKYAIDDTRVYALGVSNGGFMANAWACAPGGDLRAIVNVSGAAPGPADPPCAPTRPVSVLQLHGDADDVVRYGGGRMNDVHPSVRDGLSRFLGVDGCESAPVERRRFGGFEPDIVETEWRCARGRVELWTVPGGGHQLKLGLGVAGRTLDFLEGK